MSIFDANYLKNNPKLSKAISSALNKQPPPKIGVFKALKVDQSKATEDAEAVVFAEHLDKMINSNKIQKYTHIPNETYTPYHSVKNKLKAMGVKSGTPDYFIVTHYELLVVELKRSKGGVTSEAQDEWLTALRSVGIKAVVCHGAEQAIAFVEKNLGDTSGKMVFN